MNNSKPVPFANVVLTDSANNIVTGSITEDDGTFSISAPAGQYKVTVSFLGYEDWTKQIDATSDLNLGEIVIQDASTTLEGVEIVAKKPLIQRKTDRLIFNVDQSISAQGGDAVDALRLAPGVTVQDGAIAILGKSGMRIMIDGRILNLSGEEMTNFLNSIQANDIKSIEIITTPPAKYEAQGNGGLINIILKKAKENSWNNTISANTKIIRVPLYSIGNNFKYRKGGVNILATGNVRFGDQRYLQEAETFYSQKNWDFRSRQDRDIEDYSGRFILDYNLSDNSTIGFQIAGNKNSALWDDTSNVVIRDNATTNIDSIINSVGTRNLKTENISANAHYNVKLDTIGRKISVDLDYFNYDADDTRGNFADAFQADGTLIGPNYSGINVTGREIDNYSLSFDVEHPLKKINLSYGFRVSYIDSRYDVNNVNDLENINEFDRFTYLERNQAVYLNAVKQLSEKWSVQMGLRLENTDTQGTTQILNITTDIDYLKLFPSLYLSYVPNDNHSFSLNYGRRINRPYFAQLNPTRFFVNQNTFSVGNPFLQPSFNNNFEFTHLYKGKLSTTIFYEIETDGVGTVVLADDTTFDQEIRPYNYFRLTRFGLSESYSFRPKPWWSSQNFLYLVNYDSKITNNNFDAPVGSNFSYYLSTNNSFTLDEDNTKSIQVDYWYSAPFTTNQTENEANQSLNLGYRMSMFKKKVQFGVNLLDVFNSSPRKSISTVNGVRSTHLGYGLFRGRGIRFSLSYNFGNKKINVRQRRSGNNEEQRRTN
ncbi:TonB-dependent receptor domain-containing protein [Kordia sp.]|uniref:TonB-dependent receptor domain-containing protein n=1 Tax=Kordia sp. TaxID=1965332 RepID=UPI003B59ABF3